MPTTTDDGLCRFGQWCRTPDGLDVGRGLCWACERHAEHVIGLLPATHHQLCARIPKDAGRRGLGRIAGPAGPQAPVHVEFDALARHIAWVLGTWEHPVREVIGAHPVREHGVRDIVVVARAARVLGRHFSALLALPDTAYLPYGAQVGAVCDGPAAVVELVGLYHRGMSLLGETRRWEPRALPCPATNPGGRPGCGLYTLGRWVGDSKVVCTNCGWWCTDNDYAWYTATWQPPTMVGVAR